MRLPVVTCARRWALLLPLVGAAVSACPRPAPELTPASKRSARTSHSATGAFGATPDTLLEQRLARLELRLLERDAQVADLQGRLDDARQEVVRALAKLQTVASRAEAASALAEAEIALQPLRAGTGPQAGPALAQATSLLAQGTAEFSKQNYGGALYLANEAKSVVGVGKGRGGDPARAPLRPGETPFAVPIPLQAVARGNLREGPGTSYDVLVTVEPGTPLVGYAATEQWVRVADESGRSGWIYLTLIGRRQDSGR
ncbi:MAG TPA: SH3 domain-containing protein [Gemmatimonadales bacterium]|nr:SH3 domain-containing protein [Gemmatimonadales bacterium]